MPDIDAVLAQAAAANPVPGFVAAAVMPDRTLYQAAFGPSDLEGGPPIAPDAVFRIASLTKPIAAVAAMQLVEAGRLDLDEPLAPVLPALGAVKVFEGVAEDGTPRMRVPVRPITLRRLLTHTSGFCYDMWNADLADYVARAGTPPIMTGLNAALDLPLMFDPGDRWEYGIGLDWVGKVIEAVSGQALDAYLEERVFAPLGMADTAFSPTPAMAGRLAGVCMRQTDGVLTPCPLPPSEPEFHAAGSGLLSTAGDYLAFLQMIIGGGPSGGAAVLQPATLELMRQDQLNGLPIRRLATAAPFLTRDLVTPAASPAGWGLGGLVHAEPGPNGRSAGSFAWGGLLNTYFWADPKTGVAGVWMTQLLPFEDPGALSIFGAFERAVYGV